MRYIKLLLIVFTILGCERPAGKIPLQKDIDSLVLIWVPDSREGLLNVFVSELSAKKVVLKGETDNAEAKADLINLFASRNLEVIDSLNVLPDRSVIKNEWGIVSISAGNLKKSPSHSSELISQVIMGTPLKILKKSGGWIFVQSPDHYLGWISDSGVEELTMQQIEKWRTSERVIFMKKIGTIFSDIHPGEVVSDIVPGSILVKTGYDSKTVHVVLPDGRTGTVENADVADLKKWSDEVTPDAGNLIKIAKTMLGTPYLWGGTSSKAFDCSGFMKTLYFMNGILLARDASLQYLHGKPVDISATIDSLKPGDLIFLGSDNNGKKRIYHVGMYIGDTEVIHCSGMVKINSLDNSRVNFSNYLKSGLIGARRIIGTPTEKGLETIKNNGWYF
jgi:gamma-D-glutamyl-L-lysine dipeptidyl-peptidase